MAELTVGLDIGTTSVKALAVDADGAVVGRARVPHALHAPTVDVFEHDADEAWRRGPRQAMRELGGDSYRGVCFASLVPSCTAVDAAGVPTTPGLLYGDHRGRGPGAAGDDPVSSGEWRAMLEWTAAQAPGARGIWPAPAVGGVALGGEPAVDLGVGFALHPLWDGEWQADRLAPLGLTPAQLPVIGGATTEPVGRIGDAAQGAAVADAWAEATVAGADAPGDALVILGTTLIVWATLAEERQVPGLWLIPHPRGGRLVIGGASNAGGLFVNWARRLLGAAAAPDPHRVPVWVPYLRGERTPVHDVARRAELRGLDLTHDAGALLRAAYEASAFSVRRMLDLGAPETTRLVASGGGVHDPAWVQAVADCTGRPVDVVAVPEGAALGAAWYARMAAGLESSADDAARWIRYGGRVEPDPAWQPACADRYEEWRAVAG